MAYRESSATKARGGKQMKEEMGMWLSLLPPGCHRCPICSKRFNSLQAVGGNQNAHRTIQIKIQLNDVDVNLYEEEKERRKKVIKGKPIGDDRSCNCISDEFPMVVTNDHSVVANSEDQSEIDLNLHLGFGPHKEVTKFFDFMSVNEVKQDGVGASGSRELSDLSLGIYGSEGGISTGGHLLMVSVSDSEHGGKVFKKKFTFKKKVKLTLEL